MTLIKMADDDDYDSMDDEEDSTGLVKKKSTGMFLLSMLYRHVSAKTA